MSQATRTRPQEAPPTRPVSFEALYAAHAEQVYLWALRYARGRTGWAEDVTHDVFMRAWEQRAWLREADVKGWLFRVTQNLAFSALRREHTFRHKLWRLLVPTGRADPSPSPETAYVQQEALHRAEGALARLPDQERVVLSMKLLDGLSQREIAQALSLSEGYVSKLTHRAQARMEAWGWEVDDGTP
jgi:RNA polymerase sigma-70 factor (ECF subfamily)